MNKKVVIILIVLVVILMNNVQKKESSGNVVITNRYTPSSSGNQLVQSINSIINADDNLQVNITIKNDEPITNTYLVELTLYEPTQSLVRQSIACDVDAPYNKHTMRTLPPRASETFVIEVPSSEVTSHKGYGTYTFRVISYDSCCAAGEYHNPNCAAVSPFFDSGSNNLVTVEYTEPPTPDFTVISKSAVKEGNHIKASYTIKNNKNVQQNFILETQVDYQSKKGAQIGPPSVCNINCKNNVYRSVSLYAGETSDIEMVIPTAGDMPQSTYYVKAVSADSCFGDTSKGPFPDQPIIAENIQINSGITAPSDLCGAVYCGDAECQGLETHSSCPQDCAATCDDGGCIGWSDVNCGSTPCLINQRKQTRTCTINGCSLSRCVNDETCGQTCSALNVGDQINCTISGCIGKQTCNNNQWGVCVKDDPNCGVCNESSCGNWNICSNNSQSRTCTDSDCLTFQSCAIKTCASLGGACSSNTCASLNMTSVTGANDCPICCKEKVTTCEFYQTKGDDGACKTSAWVWMIGIFMGLMIFMKMLGGKK